jgi:hypothetical protein
MKAFRWQLKSIAIQAWANASFSMQLAYSTSTDDFIAADITQKQQNIAWTPSLNCERKEEHSCIKASKT